MVCADLVVGVHLVVAPKAPRRGSADQTSRLSKSAALLRDQAKAVPHAGRSETLRYLARSGQRPISANSDRLVILIVPSRLPRCPGQAKRQLKLTVMGQPLASRPAQHGDQGVSLNTTPQPLPKHPLKSPPINVVP